MRQLGTGETVENRPQLSQFHFRNEPKGNVPFGSLCYPVWSHEDK